MLETTKQPQELQSRDDIVSFLFSIFCLSLTGISIENLIMPFPINLY